MDVQDALREAATAAGWSPAKIAAEAGVSEQAARNWLAGTPPGSGAVLALMRGLPGFAERLGFQAVQRAA